MRSDIFRMGRGLFFMVMLRRYGMWWLGSVAALAAAGVVAGIFIDLRWIVVALMIVFILTPAVAAFLYFAHGLAPECVVNVVPHTVEFRAGELAVETYRTVTVTDEEGNETETLEPAAVSIIGYKDLGRYEVGFSSVIFTYGKGFLWIPTDAFPEARMLAEGISMISGS